MSGPSYIEWTDATWNPVRGCVKVSPGCKRCYAETFAERFRGVPGHPYEHGFDPRPAPDKLDDLNPRALGNYDGLLIYANHTKISSEQEKALQDYGMNLGIAFQLADDVLDYTSEAEFGKEKGVDLKEGKITLPLLHSLNLYGPVPFGLVRMSPVGTFFAR